MPANASWFHLTYLPTRDMVVNILTKVLPRELHWKHMHGLGLIRWEGMEDGKKRKMAGRFFVYRIGIAKRGSVRIWCVAGPDVRSTLIGRKAGGRKDLSRDHVARRRISSWTGGDGRYNKSGTLDFYLPTLRKETSLSIST
jgi:hypothetical protein